MQGQYKVNDGAENEVHTLTDGQKMFIPAFIITL